MNMKTTFYLILLTACSMFSYHYGRYLSVSVSAQSSAQHVIECRSNGSMRIAGITFDAGPYHPEVGVWILDHAEYMKPLSAHGAMMQIICIQPTWDR